MARTADEISRAIRAQLQVIDPDISADPLTPERKIIDTVAEVMTEAELDNYILNYQFDIDTKVGQDLDKFVALFGFSRQGGRRAFGNVTFSRGTSATEDITIPVGTQVMKPASSVSAEVIFQTTATVTIYQGTDSVEAPIQCITAGAIGNVPANSIISFPSGVADISDVVNENATSGGSAIETDVQLRVRFKNTIFRNVAGTKDQYLALAIASRFANKANVIGPISRFIEYLQIANNTPTGGQTGAISQIPYAKYTYPFDYYLTDGELLDEVFYTPRGVEYTFDSTAVAGIPRITVANATVLPIGTVVLLEHSYCSKNSRNDPANDIGNYVDVYVSGEDVVSVSEATRFPTSAQDMNGTISSPYYRGNWVRYETNTPADPASEGNRFQELMWQPVVDLPNTITIGAQTFTKNLHYWLVRDITTNKGSRRARNGIEWADIIASSTAIGDTLPAFTLEYSLDKLPLSLNELMEAHKQVSADVLVHSALERFFEVRLSVMYSSGYSRTAVDEAITTALTDFLERQDFGAVIQISDILDVAHDVPGVDNVKLTAGTGGMGPLDPPTFETDPYGIQEFARDGVTPIGDPYVEDFALQDSDLPVLQRLVTVRRSQNTWN